MKSAESKKDTVSFLIDNMKEMEIELRAHAMVLEALSASIITPPEIRGGLELARRSSAMQEYVQEKYAQLQDTRVATFSPTTRDMADLLQLSAFSGPVN